MTSTLRASVAFRLEFDALGVGLAELAVQVRDHVLLQLVRLAQVVDGGVEAQVAAGGSNFTPSSHCLPRSGLKLWLSMFATGVNDSL